MVSPNPGFRPTTLILFEFGGVSSEFNFTAALPSRPDQCTVTIDPLYYADPRRYCPISCRIDAIAEHVLAQARPGRAAIVASCVCVGLLDPLSVALEQAGADIQATVAVDPQEVSLSDCADVLGELCEKLGGDGAQEALADITRLDPEEMMSCAVRNIEDWVSGSGLTDDIDLSGGGLGAELIDRYSSWAGFLLSLAYESGSCASSGERHLFLVDGDSVPGRFGSTDAYRHIYECARPVLADPRVGADLRTLLWQCGWQPS